jgi:hypothetical protein
MILTGTAIFWPVLGLIQMSWSPLAYRTAIRLLQVVHERRVQSPGSWHKHVSFELDLTASAREILNYIGQLTSEFVSCLTFSEDASKAGFRDIPNFGVWIVSRLDVNGGHSPFSRAAWVVKRDITIKPVWTNIRPRMDKYTVDFRTARRGTRIPPLIAFEG